jgi:hypothetical protein
MSQPQIETRTTVAACDTCGRGFMWVNPQIQRGERAGYCFKPCPGRVRNLPVPEQGIKDGPAARQSRIALLQSGRACS